MREFGYSFDALLELPLKRFWFLVNQIGRLQAEQDLRQLQLMGSAADGEALKAAFENLRNEQGQVFVWEETGPKEIRIDPNTGLDPEFDRAGLQRLKALSKLKEGQVV